MLEILPGYINGGNNTKTIRYRDETEAMATSESKLKIYCRQWCKECQNEGVTFFYFMEAEFIYMSNNVWSRFNHDGCKK